MLSRAKATPGGSTVVDLLGGLAVYWCLLQLYYVIPLHHPDLWLIDVILVPTLLSALHSDDLWRKLRPLKTQYLGARGAGRECLELELD